MKMTVMMSILVSMVLLGGCKKDATEAGNASATATGAKGKVVVGIPNWPSGNAKGHVYKTIIEENLGLEVELQTGTNAVIFAAMDKGSMHIHPETWSPNHDNLIKQYVTDKKTVKAAVSPTAKGESYICTTEGTVQRTGIKNLSELTNPAMSKKFDSDGDGKGEIWIGAAGWGSTEVEKIRAKSYGYDATMKLKVMDEGLALAEVKAAVAKKQNIVFYCYAPHYMFVLHKLVKLKEPPHDPSKWKIVRSNEDPAWLEKSTAACAWPSAIVGTHYAASLEKTHPQVAKLFSRISFTDEDANDMSFQLSVNKVSPEDYAKKWVKNNATQVDTWLQ